MAALTPSAPTPHPRTYTHTHRTHPPAYLPPTPSHPHPQPNTCRLIFVAKTTLAYIRKFDDVPAAAQKQRQGRRGGGAAAAAIDPSAVDGDCDTPEPAVRRRRTRRD